MSPTTATDSQESTEIVLVTTGTVPSERWRR
jgi:hypothetical protein